MEPANVNCFSESARVSRLPGDARKTGEPAGSGGDAGVRVGAFAGSEALPGPGGGVGTGPATGVRAADFKDDVWRAVFRVCAKGGHAVERFRDGRCANGVRHDRGPEVFGGAVG